MQHTTAMICTPQRLRLAVLVTSSTLVAGLLVAIATIVAAAIHG